MQKLRDSITCATLGFTVYNIFLEYCVIFPKYDMDTANVALKR